MKGHLGLVLGLVFVVFAASAADDVVGAVDGTVTNVSAATKTIVVKTVDGTEHAFHFVGRTSINGTADVSKGAKDTFHGLREGNHVVVHYTAKGTEETAEEVDRVGKGGLKASKGTVKAIDRSAKIITVKTTDGAEETFYLTDRAALDGGKRVGEGVEKSGHVTVYYTEEAGQKFAHFFEKMA